MATTRPLRTGWTAERDEVFFRIVQALYPPAWLSAASVLLASYDDDVDAASAGRYVVSVPSSRTRQSLLASGSG